MDCPHVVFVQHLSTHQALVLTVIPKGGSNIGNNNTGDDDANENLTTVIFFIWSRKASCLRFSSSRAEELFMFILISGGRRVFMPRDQVLREKRVVECIFYCE